MSFGKPLPGLGLGWGLLIGAGFTVAAGLISKLRQDRGAERMRVATAQLKRETLDETDEGSDSDEDSSSEEVTEEPVRMVLLNIQSIMTCRNNIPGLTYAGDVVFLTETWLQPDTGDKVLKQCLWCRKDFQFFQQARETRGGGVAVLFSKALEAQQIDSSPNISFECLVASMRHKTWRQPILTITLYRQPGGNVAGFLAEFKRILDKFSNYNSIIVTGDFNIWVDDETKEPARRFKQFLEDNGLIQHVKRPTHPSRHTLDVVISRNVEVSKLSVEKNVMSDHYTVLFSARPLSKEANKKNNKRMYPDHEEGQIKKRKK